jgi:hypothetical protein
MKHKESDHTKRVLSLLTLAMFPVSLVRGVAFLIVSVLLCRGLEAFTLLAPPVRPTTTLYHQPIVVPDAADLLLFSEQVNRLVDERACARAGRDFATADALLVRIQAIAASSSEDGLEIRVSDHAGGISSWCVLYNPAVLVEEQHTSSVLQLAHAALGRSVVVAKQQQAYPNSNLLDEEDLVLKAKTRLQQWAFVQDKLEEASSLARDDDDDDNDNGMLSIHWSTLQALGSTDLTRWATVDSELQGRKAADAAFWFALAGATDEELFTLLTRVVIKELDRFGCRPHCRLKDVRFMVQRLAAAGVRENPRLTAVVRRCFAAKNANDEEHCIHLHSDHTALMLWEVSTRQRKQKSFLDQAAQHWESSSEKQEEEDLERNEPNGNEYRCDWNALFDNPQRPLVIDVGCGMGLSLLGLVSSSSLKENSQSKQDGSFHSQECNFLGVDLNAVTIGYAKGIAQRWKLQGRLAFVVGAAYDVLQDIARSYPGPVVRIMIQFPTPYRLAVATTSRGNSQLPSSPTDGFMVTSELLQLAQEQLLRNSTDNNNNNGELFLQSNCEDVAVWMQTTACEAAGFCCQQVHDPVMVAPTQQHNPQQRTLNWIAMGGKRAVGPGWSSQPLLPRNAMTETEVACILRGTPVHRCVLVPK